MQLALLPSPPSQAGALLRVEPLSIMLEKSRGDGDKGMSEDAPVKRDQDFEEVVEVFVKLCKKIKKKTNGFHRNVCWFLISCYSI